MPRPEGVTDCRTMPSRRWGTALGLVLACGVLGACGASLPTSSEEAATETAETVCSLLRDWNNDLTEVFNATSAAITDADDPATSVDVLVGGFDDMIAVAEANRDELDDVDLPTVDERDDLIAELEAGADESIAVLEEERADAAALPPIEIDDQGGAIGGASVGLERATSVLEPSIGDYDEETLRDAFATEDGCAQVIQPF
jgi:hypothetical protein